MLKHLLPIIDSIPHTCYVEAFGGSAAVLLNKVPSKIEVLNDINGNIYTLYKVLRDPVLSVRLIENLNLTLHSMTDFKHAKQVCLGDCEADDVELARCTFVKYAGSFGGNGSCFAHTRTRNVDAQNVGSRIIRMPIFHERIKHVTIENEGYEKNYQTLRRLRNAVFS